MIGLVEVCCTLLLRAPFDVDVHLRSIAICPSSSSEANPRVLPCANLESGSVSPKPQREDEALWEV